MLVDVRDAGAFPVQLTWTDACAARRCRIMARQVEDQLTGSTLIWCWHAPEDYPAERWRDSMNWDREEFTLNQIEVMVEAWVGAVHEGGRYHLLGAKPPPELKERIMKAIADEGGEA
jgi:hypothetical protein